MFIVILILVDFMDDSKKRMHKYSEDKIQAQSKDYFKDNFLIQTISNGRKILIIFHYTQWVYINLINIQWITKMNQLSFSLAPNGYI